MKWDEFSGVQDEDEYEDDWYEDEIDAWDEFYYQEELDRHNRYQAEEQMRQDELVEQDRLNQDPFEQEN